MSEQVWLPLIRSANREESLGQAVLRLAALAEAGHMHQVSESLRGEDARSMGADGPAPQDVVAAITRGEGHTEVDL